ncbi:hypothetical protein AB0A94_31860 [Streptomyces sp. NPDC044984]|uniref:hypothetical protein n=1 Tax=Streptomyces sp. NPDC044984 TaxID=3154335 RepID=UPI003401C873
MSNALALPRLLPVRDRDKDIEIPALRHQITVLERQPGAHRPRFTPTDQVDLAVGVPDEPDGEAARDLRVEGHVEPQE